MLDQRGQLQLAAVGVLVRRRGVRLDSRQPSSTEVQHMRLIGVAVIVLAAMIAVATSAPVAHGQRPSRLPLIAILEVGSASMTVWRSRPVQASTRRTRLGGGASRQD